jgi:hypothetical protein
MHQKYELILKPIPLTNEDNARIYEMLKNSCAGLNNYLSDFFETVAILKEKPDSGHIDINESIQSVLGKIDEVTASMKKITQDMPEFVELKEYSELMITE